VRKTWRGKKILRDFFLACYHTKCHIADHGKGVKKGRRFLKLVQNLNQDQNGKKRAIGND
jgi:hypothetical protein